MKIILAKLFFFLSLLTIPKSLDAEDKSVAIAAIFQDEAPYLKEWIEFHKLIGIEHFYLYDNCSSDNPLNILQSYIDNGEVDYIYLDLPFSEPDAPPNRAPAAQNAAYEDAVTRAKHNYYWLALIDIDEFIVLPNKTPLPVFLEEFKEYGGLVINWLMFGTSGYASFDENQLLVEHLTFRADRPCEPIFDEVKSIVQPLKVRCVNPHCSLYHSDFKPANSEHRIILDDLSNVRGGSIDKIRIHHYFVRSKEFLETTKAERMVRRYKIDNQDAINDLYLFESQCYDIEDFTAHIYLKDLKDAMMQN